MTRQLSELESEFYTKIITAIDAVTKLIDKTAQSLPRDSEVRRYLAYCAFDVRNNLLDSMYNKLMHWEGGRMTKPTRSQMKEARCMLEDVTELNELYADVKLITKKVEALLEKIAHMSTAKKTDYNAFLDSINKVEI